MSSAHAVTDATRPPPDRLLRDITDYALDPTPFAESALRSAHWCLLDSLGCAMLALRYADCRRVLGPIVPGAELANGARVPGTAWTLDPVAAAWNLGVMIRWLDFNDTWLAAEWGHPSDNFGALLALADYLGRQRAAAGEAPLTIRDLLNHAIKAYEIQGVLALNHSFNRVGLDHVLLVRVASAATAAAMLTGDAKVVFSALSNAWLDGGALRTYRHAPNTGSRKSWAAGDATSRATRLALLAQRGEMGYESALTAPKWGFQDVLFKGQPMALARPLGSYVIENVLFKIAFPAEFHAQTAVEAGFTLHTSVKHRLHDIARIELTTHESAIRIIHKTGPLSNPADRDHCLQYMTAIALIHGELTADHYEDAIAADPRIDQLRELMEVREEPRYSADYLDPDKRSIANALRVVFKDGSATPIVEVEYPLGHRRRRDEGLPLLQKKFTASVNAHFPASRADAILRAVDDPERFAGMPVHEFLSLWVTDRAARPVGK